MTRKERVAIIGVGHVGATSAYALMLRALFSEIVLLDSDAALARAEAADLSDANAMARPARIWSGDYAEAADARIAVVTAGAVTHGAQSRLSVTAESAAIVAPCVEQLMLAGFRGVLLVAANPVDLMAMVAYRASGLPASQVIGTGTLLDSSRLRQTLAALLDVAPDAIEGLVLGEHGDSEVVAYSGVRVGGLTLEAFAAGRAAPDRGLVADQVRDAGYRIVQGKGYTSFGIATAIVRICEAIVRNERTVLPVSTLLRGEYGISDIFMSLPCLIGIDGVAEVLTPALSDDETRDLRASAETLRRSFAAAGLAAGGP